MKIFDFTTPGWWLAGWWLVGIGVLVLIGIVWMISSGMGDPELKKILETPVKDMTVGHLAGLIVLAGLFLGR